MPDKKFYVQIPGTTQGMSVSAEDFEAKKDKLFNTYKDAVAVEMQDYTNGEDVGDSDFVVTIPGTTEPMQINAADFSKKKDKLFEQYPDAKVTRVRGVNYWGDKWREDEDRIRALEDELKGIPEEAPLSEDPRVIQGGSVAGMQKLMVEKTRQDEPNRARRGEINREIEQIKRDREQNPAWQQYWQQQDKENADARSRIDKMRQEHKKVMDEHSMDSALAAFDDDYLDIADRFYKDAKKMIDAPSKYADDNQGALGDFWQGIKDTGWNALSLVDFAQKLHEIPFLETIKTIQKNEGNDANVYDLVKNHPDRLYEMGMGDAEVEMLKAFVHKADIESGKSDLLTKSYQAGQSMAKSLGFMADFIAFGGIGDAAAEKVAGKLVESAGRRALPKLAAETFGGLAKAAAMTPLMPSTYANFIGNLEQFNDAGGIDLSGKALLKDAGDILIENVSETVGAKPLELIGIPLQKVKFPDWAKAFRNTPVAGILKQAGYNGFFEEMFEEWTGSALRAMTGVDKDALKDFKQVDQLLITAGSFAPVALFGGAATTAQFHSASKAMREKGLDVDNIIAGLQDENAKAAVKASFDATRDIETPEDFAHAMTDVYKQIVDNGGNEEQAFKAVMDYTEAASRYKVMNGMFEEQKDVERSQKLLEMDQQMGNANWHHYGDNGASYVRTITDEQGNERFVVAETDGELALVDREGNNSFLTEEKLNEGVNSGTLMDSGETPLFRFLDNQSESEKKQEEQVRMAAESNAAMQELQQRAQPGVEINVGTVENPIVGTIRGFQAGEYIVQMQDGSVRSYTPEAMANTMGIRLTPETDEEIEAKEIAQEERRATLRKDINGKRNQTFVTPEGKQYTILGVTKGDAEKPFVLYVKDEEEHMEAQMLTEEELSSIASSVQPAVESVDEVVQDSNPTVQVADDVPRDFRGNPLPLRTNSVTGEQEVDSNALWNEDPEAWVRWNDTNPDQDVTSDEKLDYNIDLLTKKYEEGVNAIKEAALSGAEQEQIDALKAGQRETRKRLTQLEGIKAGRVNAENAANSSSADNAVTNNTATPVANAAGETPAVGAESNAAPATAEEILASTQAALDTVDQQMAQVRSAEDYRLAMEAKAEALQQMFDALGAENTVVSTRADIVEVFRAAGGSEANARELAENLHLTAGKERLRGFYNNGKIFIIADDIRGAEDANVTQLHEAKHLENAATGAVNEGLRTGVTEDEMRAAVFKRTGSHFYDDKSRRELVDEVLANAEEIAERDGVEAIPQRLAEAGIVNGEFINFVQNNINNGRRGSQRRHLGGRHALQSVDSEVSGREDVRDTQPQPAAVEGQGLRLDAGGEQGAGWTAEQPAEPAGTVAIPTAEEDLHSRGLAANEEETRFSIRYMPDEANVDKIADDISRLLNISKAKARRWVKSETSLAPIILDENNSPYLNYEGDDRYSAIKEDSDYPQGTVDFNNICRKRIAFTNVYQRLQKDFPNTVITGEDLAKIRTIMKDHGLMVACGLCYVEDRRQLLGKIARFFIEELNNNFDGYIHGRTLQESAKDKVSPDKQKKANNYLELIGNDKKEDLSIYDLITLDGSDKLAQEHPGIYAAFQRFNADRGQQSGNLFEGYAEYKREIQYWTDKKVAKVNALGGLRIFSYSDFEAHHLIDLVQIIQDCAKRGVMIQGYTKVPAFARAIANTNIKMNRSLIPLGDTGIVDGKLAFDPVEGIDFNSPDFLESNDNVGNILIGINDEQIRLAMADPNIHYIIPYHSNQKGVLRQMKQTGAWTNYKNEQTEKGENTGKHGVNIYTDVLAAAEAEGNPVRTEKQFVERFLNVCKEKGWTPRFSRFLNTNEAGEYVYTPGYYKLLLDFKLFDENGKILPQKPVVAEFDDAFNQKILEDYVRDAQTNNNVVSDDVYNEIVNALGLQKRAPQLTEAQRFAYEFVNGTPVEEDTSETSSAEGDNLRFSISEETQKLFDAAKERFGTTRDIREAGYVLPDGTMLDFSGRHWLAPGSDSSYLAGDRQVDHRDIADLEYERDGNTPTGIETSMPDFIRRGAIRINDGSGASINLAVKPTPEQASVLTRLIEHNNGDVYLDLGDGERTDASTFYEGAKARRVINDIKRYFDEGVAPEGGLNFSIRGILGAAEDETAMANLDTAKQMDADGKDAKTIWLATGWEKGADGKWRNEIPDATPKPFGLSKRTLKVEDIVDAPELFASYPEMKDYKVSLKKMSGAGAFNPKEKEIEMDRDYNTTIAVRDEDQEAAKEYFRQRWAEDPTHPADIRKDTEKKYGVRVLDATGLRTVMHELQHAIQDIEGFARGGNSKTQSQDYLSAAYKRMPEAVTFARAFSSRNAAGRLLRVGRARMIDYIDRNINAFGRADEREMMSELRDYLAGTDDYGYRRLVNDAAGLWKIAKEQGNERYNRLAGEVEARNVETRMGLTEEQRRETPISATEDVAREEQGLRFSIREKEPPKKTGIGYKVFYQKDGKLYPPMVANPGGKETPVGVWLDADAAPIAGESKTGRPQVKAGGKGTQGGSGTLAYRPGWHLGEIPYAVQFNRVNPETGKKELFPKDFVWAEVEYAADNDYQQEAEAEGITENGKYRHSYAGLKKVPEDGFYRYRTNPNPETDHWIITGSMKVNRILTDEEVDDMVRAAGREPQKREGNDMRFSIAGFERFSPEIQEEMADIKAKAEADGTYLKAPNGKDTRLSPLNWLLVRTRNFKKWFGDWEKHYRIEKLKARKPIEHVFGNEYALDRKSAKDWMKANLKGDYTNADTKERINISNVGVNEVFSHGSTDEAHIKSISAIPRLIEDSIFIEERPNSKDNDKYDSYRYYVAGINIDKQDYTAKVVIGVKGDSKYYDHRLSTIEKGALIDTLNRLSNSVDVTKTPGLSGIKDSKLISLLQENYSKVLDENGEPLVVYHGTPDMSFTTFAKPGEGYQGLIWVTDQKRYAEVYAEEYDGEGYQNEGAGVYQLFANIRNPLNLGYIEDVVGSDEWNRIASDLGMTPEELFNKLNPVKNYPYSFEDAKKRMAYIYDFTRGAEFVNLLKEKGFDGAFALEEGINKTPTYGAVEPNQVKSVDWNNGNFSTSNEDIRFSVKGEPESLFDRYDKQDGEQYPWMSEDELIDRIEEEIPYGVASRPLYAKIDEYRRLDEEDFDEGRRDFSGGEKNEVFQEILSELQKYEKGADQQSLRFSIANENQSIFVSNAENAVRMIQMGKATPEQWQKMIEKNGGLKAGEDKWLGLSDWLKASDRKSITKQEILDFIDQNKIRIEETRYAQEVEEYDMTALKSYDDEFNSIIREMTDAQKESAAQREPALIANDAFNEMIERYGDDFDSAFTYNDNQDGSFSLEPEMDIYDDRPTDAAKYYLDQRSGAVENRINRTRLSYTTEGLDNKREIALTIPTIESWNENDEIHFGDAGQGRAIAWVRFGDDTIDEGNDAQEADMSEQIREYEQKRNSLLEEFASKYGFELRSFDPTRIMPMLSPEDAKRLQDVVRTKPIPQDRVISPKKKVLFIDEIQSKRHQEGREKGYRMSDKERDEVFGASRKAWQNYQAANQEYNEYLQTVFGEAYDPVSGSISKEQYDIVSPSDEQLEHITNLGNSVKEAKSRWNEANNNAEAFAQNSGTIPAAPFEKNWHELAMKRMLRLAAEEGYDYVAWTKGDQQAERYNLGNVVSKISVFPDNEFGGRQVIIRTNSNDFIDLDVDDKGIVENGEYRGKPLSDVLGKDLASKIIADTENSVYEGDGLRIGGEGMKGFYDDILPRFVNKYAKKWGVKVEDINLPNLESNGITAHAIPVTEEMKESVMEGQLMFSVQAVEEQGNDVEYDASINAMRDAASEVAAKCGIEIEYKPSQAMRLNGKPLAGKWVNGRMYVCLEHCRDEADAVRTVLHEGVGHNGLRRLVGNENMSAFCLDMFNRLPETDRREIASAAVNKYGGNIAEAVEEHLAEKAETMDFDDDFQERSFWDVVRDGVRSLLAKVGINVPMSERDIRWLMWQSYNANKQGDILNEAKRQTVANKLGFTLRQQADVVDARQSERNRFAEQDLAPAARLYNKDVMNWMNRLHETWVDKDNSVKILVDSLEKVTGSKAKAFEDVRLALNQQSSKGLAAIEKFEREHYNPMMDAIKALMKAKGCDLKAVERYVMIKHGLERNDVFAKRDAREYYQKVHDDAVSTIRGSKTIEAEEKERLIAKEDEKLQRRLSNIEAGTDLKYKELRNQDYGGLTAMYSEFDPIEPFQEGVESEEEYNARVLNARHPKYTFVDENGHEQVDMRATEAAAEEETSKFEEGFGKEIDELWKRINGATKATLKHQYDSNMMSRQQYLAVRDMFQYYVPLRGFAENTAGDMYDYYQSDQRNSFTPPLQKAKGRKTESESPFGYIGAMASSGIAADMKNETKLSLYYFVSNRAANDLVTISDVWYEKTGEDEDGKEVFTPVYPPLTEDLSSDEAKKAYEDWENSMKEKAKTGIAVKGTNKLDLHNSVIHIDDRQKASHVIKFKVGGRDMMMFINGNPRAAQAINNELNVEMSTDYQKVFGKVLRWFSGINTSYNPEFWLSNAQRDLLFAIMSVNVKENPEYNSAFQKNLGRLLRKTLTPGAKNGAYSLKKKLDSGELGDAKLDRLYKEFVENGAVTGYTVLKNNEEWELELRKYTGEEKKVVQGIKNAFEKVQNFGEAIEQMTRFAAYITSREQGKDIKDSVNDAKELTVNFNRKGSGKAISFKEAEKLRTKDGKKLNAAQKAFVVGASWLPVYGRRFIMFFNAAVQGLNAMYKLVKKNPGKLAAWTAGYLTLGAMQAAAHALLDDDDDYLDIPDYERRNNLLIGGNGGYFKWALPQESRVFYAIGDMAVNHMLGREPHKSMLSEVLLAAADIAPLNPAGGISALAPSAITPVIEVILNRDYKGSKIYNDLKYLSDEERKRTPAYQKAYTGTGKVYVAMSQFANWLSGGDYADAGWININPAAVEHIMKGATGGAGTTLGKLYRGTVGQVLGEEFMVRNTPFISRLFTVTDERYRNAHTTELFDYYKAEAEHTKKMIRTYQKNGDDKRLNRIMDSDDYEIMSIYESYRKLLEWYNDELKATTDKKDRKALMREQDAVRKDMILEISEIK